MKKLFSIALVALLALPLFAVNHLSSRELAFPQLEKKAALRQSSNLVHRAPRAAMDMAFSATYVEAAYYGSYTDDINDWVFFFVGNSNNVLIYADVYGAADATHIDGTYSLADGSIYEAFVVRAAGDTIDATGGTITVSHNTATNYHFEVALTAGNETFTLSQDLDVEAYDYLNYYYYYYYGFEFGDIDIYLEDAGENPNPNPGEDPSTGADYSYEPTVATTVNKTMNTAVFDTQYFAEYGDVDLYLYDVNAQGDTTEVALFYVYVPQIDQTTYIPAGTYTFSADPTVGNVEASTGLLNYYGQYYPTPAYYALRDAEGYITTIYYLVSGQLTLTRTGDNLTVQVNATSGNGSTVNISYSTAAPSTALDNVDALSADKFLRDGQILIRKNGRVYNALGQTVE